MLLTSNRIYIVFMIFILTSIFFVYGTIAEGDIKSEYTILDPNSLHRIPEDSNNIMGYDNAGIFIDGQNHIIVMSSYGTRENGKHKGDVYLSIYNGDKWINSYISTEGYPHFFGVVNDGIFEVYQMDYDEKQEIIFHNIYVHDLADENTIYFNNEGRAVRNGIVFPVRGKRDILYMVRSFIEDRYDPLSLFSRFASGGHGGFAGRPYILKVSHGKITERYDMSVKLNDREMMRYLDSKVIVDKIHVIWRKYTEYGSGYESDTLQYACFDFASNSWTEAIEPLGGYTYPSELQYRDIKASINGQGKRIYCAWYWTAGEKKREYYKHVKERVIYFNQARNGQWEKPKKIYQNQNKSGNCYPKVVVDNIGDVYVFWEEDYKGLYFMRKDGDNWSDPIAVVENKRIQSFDIAVDNGNGIHIIYVLHKLIPDKLPYELVYTKIIPKR